MGTTTIRFAMVCALAAGCLESPAVECAAGMVCASGTLCDPTQRGCVLPEQLDCQGQPDEAACSYQGVPDGACFDGVCRPAGCGNGEVEEGEACDDGNRLHGDGCAADCRSDETCGNGVLDATVGEACDDGNTDDGDGCQASCASPTCGDGVIDTQFNEACDDGDDNADEPDAACRTNCQLRRCGDRVTDIASGELCDDGNVLSGDGCASSCLVEECGNGILDVEEVDGRLVPAEACDDGDNGLSHDGCAALCQVELPGWRERVAVAPAIPPGRDFHAMVYDAGRGRTVVFGGLVSSQEDPRETWEWDGRNWINMTPRSAADSPPEVERHAMAYDAARRQVVLFGGEESANRLGREVWMWNGAIWQRRAPDISPTGRTSHAMAYDAARERVVLYGGFGCDPDLVDCDSGGFPGIPLGDTWEWDGESWTNVSPPADAPSPGRRTGHVMTYDAARGGVVLIGGTVEVGSESDLWMWDGTTWTMLDPAPGGIADNAGFVYDAVRENIVLIGNPMRLWDGASWTSVADDTLPLSSGGSNRFVYDIARDRIVGVSGGSFGQTFERDETSWTEVTPPFSQPAAIPPARHGHALAFDGQRGVILFGGQDQSGALLGDTWRWDGLLWKQLSPGAAPAARRDHITAFDRHRRRVVLFGGSGTSETWEWDGTTWLQGASGPSKDRPAMAYDVTNRRVVLFSGTAGPSAGETFTWDGVSWTRVSTTGPMSRAGHAVAYDAARGRVVMFGGVVENGAFSLDEVNDETWEWDGATWAQIEPPVSPAGREGHAMFYDAGRRRVILFGGRICTGSRECDPLDDVWEWDGSRWSDITPVLSPARRGLHAMAYDDVGGDAVMFGGVDESDERSLVHFADTWTLRFSNELGDEFCMAGAGVAGADMDRDGRVGCEDPDCWAACTPVCPPDSTPQWPADCDDTQPHCGDGTCDPARETCALCPNDCGPCQVCGDLVCDSTEDIASCPGDCR